MEAIQFGGALLHILKQVCTSDPRLGIVYLRKLDFADNYMRLWVRMGNFPYVAFLIPKKNPINTQLVGFHISLPMRHIDCDPYFCMVTETVDNLANKAISQREQVGKLPLEVTSKFRAINDAGTPEAQVDSSW